jgi:hypothetical protein
VPLAGSGRYCGSGFPSEPYTRSVSDQNRTKTILIGGGMWYRSRRYVAVTGMLSPSVRTTTRRWRTRFGKKFWFASAESAP